MLLLVIRALFVLVVAGLAVRVAGTMVNVVHWAISFGAVMALAALVLVADLMTPRKRIQTLSAIYLGLIVGLLLGNLLQIAIEPTLAMIQPTETAVLQAVMGLVTVLICYICVSTLLQTQDDFRFIIPYVEFSKEVKGAHPLILDTSVIIDGRIADVAETNVIDQPVIIPRFVLQELQGIADSSDKLRRKRGQRGLDVLNRLQKMTGLEVKIHDAELPELAAVREVDQRLVILAKSLGGKVVTNDYNLNKIARLQGVDVINLNDLANALKPVVLPGETLMVKLIKRGEEPGQGVGYLDDGTMVVAEQGANYLSETVRLLVTSVLQTSAGRMIFGRLDFSAGAPGGPSHGRQPAGTVAPSPEQHRAAGT